MNGMKKKNARVLNRSGQQSQPTFRQPGTVFRLLFRLEGRPVSNTTLCLLGMVSVP